MSCLRLHRISPMCDMRWYSSTNIIKSNRVSTEILTWLHEIQWYSQMTTNVWPITNTKYKYDNMIYITTFQSLSVMWVKNKDSWEPYSVHHHCNGDWEMASHIWKQLWYAVDWFTKFRVLVCLCITQCWPIISKLIYTISSQLDDTKELSDLKCVKNGYPGAL